MNPIVGVYIFFMVGIPGIKDGMTKLQYEGVDRPWHI